MAAAALATARALVVLTLAAAALPALAASQPWRHGTDLAPIFERMVERRLDVPDFERAAYAERLDAAFAQAGIALTRPQYVLLVDRDPNVQAAFVYWRDEGGRWHFIGAAPVSTGRRGGFEYFLTPVGVFAHTLADPDFRAEGTRNEFGVRGYGERGMRVFDFGWVMGERTWDGGRSPMRLQVHATDPELLEPWLGEARSKGCIRIPASLNRLLDRYGLLDADYEEALARGARLWVLAPDRTPTPWPGRYLVVVDSGRSARPTWSPPPRARPTPEAGDC